MMARTALDDFIVPVARVVDVYICEDDIPLALKRTVSGSVNLDTAREIAARYGSRAYKPEKPLLVNGPDPGVPIMVAGFGMVEAAEIEDLALGALDKQAENMKKFGRAMDFDTMREEAGFVRREDFPQVFSDAMAERAEYLIKHQRTDPLGKGDK